MGGGVALPADEALQRLRKAVEGLTYPSESDEPFDVLVWDGATGKTVRDVVAERVGRGRKVTAVSVEAFFGQLDGADEAPRYRELRAALEKSMKELSTFRVGDGEVRVDVYVVGRLSDGHVAGVHSVSVET